MNIISIIKYTTRTKDQPAELADHMRIVAFQCWDAPSDGNQLALPSTIVQRRVDNDRSGTRWVDCGERVPPAVLVRMTLNAFLAHTLPGTNRCEGRTQDGAAAIRDAEEAGRTASPPSWSNPSRDAPPWIPDMPEFLTVDLGEFIIPR
jgi:hypothetical protein